MSVFSVSVIIGFDSLQETIAVNQMIENIKSTIKNGHIEVVTEQAAEKEITIDLDFSPYLLISTYKSGTPSTTFEIEEINEDGKIVINCNTTQNTTVSITDEEMNNVNAIIINEEKTFLLKHPNIYQNMIIEARNNDIKGEVIRKKITKLHDTTFLSAMKSIDESEEWKKICIYFKAGNIQIIAKNDVKKERVDEVAMYFNENTEAEYVIQ